MLHQTPYAEPISKCRRFVENAACSCEIPPLLPLTIIIQNTVFLLFPTQREDLINTATIALVTDVVRYRLTKGNHIMRFRQCSLALLGLLSLAAFSPVQAQVIAPPQL